MVTIGSLCSGYGGLDMGLQTAIGGEVRWHFEYDKHASQILKHHHPTIPNYGDITATDWDIEPVDWITAGYPCQPFSTAGQRKGTNDARHIWPYIANAIRVLRPRGVLLENVAGHLSLGFGHVLGDLARFGYDAQWVCIRAADAGAPHNRRRVFIVANANSGNDGQRRHRGLRTRIDRVGHGENSQSRSGGQIWNDESATHTTASNATGNRRQKMPSETSKPSPGSTGNTWSGFGPYLDAVTRWEMTIGRPAPVPIDEKQRIHPPFVEWMMGLPKGWVTETGIGYGAQLRALGNGVVPQQAALALQLMGVEND